MKITDIIALAGAGFTKDDISRIAGTLTQDTNNVPVQVQIPVPMPTPTPTPTPTLAPTPAPVQNPIQQYMPTPQPNGMNFGDKLDQILGAVQNNNIMNMQVPAQPTTEDMLAEIINPRGVE